ncbi:hypothetical protein [Candidatus Xianfuyuplasma coldseepsis]|uniref:Uncharacterized protein n=1 Tax=Candidatus Xianfuyuplasma coldseepsis TaxID=2782163 RepID=A0A7L7KS62_9MOLU|nr:hypothetical protein [Xianfuyuplasma coldseepsis]QMS84628.1 hypothetical protein G4Z02_02305 [Xianfuyuplasma coldseepsis]
MKNILLRVVLVFFVFTSSTAVYAQVESNDDLYIDEAGDFYIVEQQLVGEPGQSLVPQGVILGENDVYYIEYGYQVIVKEGMELQVLIEDLLFSNSNVAQEDLEQVFHFDISTTVVETLEYYEHMFSGVDTAQVVDVTVQVSMELPGTYELYQQIVGEQLAFEVYFFAMNVS